MDSLKLAWKFVSFYELTPQTLRRLSLTYGLREAGGFSQITGADTLQTVCQQFSVLLREEADPRVQHCLAHQLGLAHRVLSLRAQGLQARVRGWLVEIEGGKRPKALRLSS
jgi:hypothetical protein